MEEAMQLHSDQVVEELKHQETPRLQWLDAMRGFTMIIKHICASLWRLTHLNNLCVCATIL